MMVDDEPTIAGLDVSKAVARRQALGLSILDVGERIIAGIDRRTAVYADLLIAERDFETRKDPEGGDEIVPQCRVIAAHRWGQGAPQDGVVGIQRQHLLGVVFA